VASGHDPIAYSECLLKVARIVRQMPNRLAMAFGDHTIMLFYDRHYAPALSRVLPERRDTHCHLSPAENRPLLHSDVAGNDVGEVVRWKFKQIKLLGS
jgi:hypothetical protein